MAGIWDSNLKRLVAANPQAFIDWLLNGAVFVRELPVHLNRGIDIDILYEASLDGKRMLVHIEFQRYDDEKMARRVLEYNVYATTRYDCPVVSFVIYLKKAGKVVESPLVQRLPGRMEIWRFNFMNVKLWEVPTEMLRQVQSVGILPLLALTREGYRPEVIDEALRGIEQSIADRSVKDNLLTITLTLATLVLDGAASQDWLRKRFYMYHDLIRDTEIYQIIMQEGLDKGVQLGRQEGRQEITQREIQDFQQTILSIFQRGFPELITLATERISTISDLNLLKNLVLDINFAKSVEQAHAILDTLTSNE